MMMALRETGAVHIASSEETPVEVDCGGSGEGLGRKSKSILNEMVMRIHWLIGFSVAFDPLDGSSIIGANFAVGTITWVAFCCRTENHFDCGKSAIFPGAGLLNRCGRELCASLVAQYGPRVTVALALNNTSTKDEQPITMEMTMLPNSWFTSTSRFVISKRGKTFAPGNLRATSDNAQYNALIQFWIQNKYTLRYSGGLVPDIYHILSKGEGVLSNASSPTAKAKLRLLYEAIPIALIIECAGGSSCVCSSEAAEEIAPTSLLDVNVSELDKRVGVCFGSIEEVERFKQYLFPTPWLCSAIYVLSNKRWWQIVLSWFMPPFHLQIGWTAWGQIPWLVVCRKSAKVYREGGGTRRWSTLPREDGQEVHAKLLVVSKSCS